MLGIPGIVPKLSSGVILSSNALTLRLAVMS
jgi:hypothetical protein